MLRDSWPKTCLLVNRTCVKNITPTTARLFFLLYVVDLNILLTQLNYYLSPINNLSFFSIRGWVLHTIHNLNYKNKFNKLFILT